MKLTTSAACVAFLFLSSCGGYTPIGEGEPMGGAAGSGGTMAGGTGGTGGTMTTGGTGGTMTTGGSGGDTMTGGTGGSTTGGTGGTGGSMTTGGTGGSGMYDPCANRACGTVCSVCDPADPDCAADAVVTYCDAGGACVPTFPMCGTNTCGTSMDCPLLGLPCQLCADGSSACPTTACVEGQCLTTYPTCPGTQCMTAAECPVSAAPCTMCADGTTVCPWSDCVNGLCTGGIDSCSGGSACEGKACGDVCTPCVGSNCDAAAPIMAASYCDENLECQFNKPMCTATECKTDMECPAIELCMACPDGNCAAMKCLEGACQWQCADKCGGCTDGQICVYQLGGPGPSHYACAEQLACGSAAACACIQEQGMCKPEQVDGYCQCDNGLE